MNLRTLRAFDWSLVVIPFLLVAFGLAILFSFSFAEQKNLAAFQLIFAVLATAIMFFLTAVDYRTFKGLSWYLYAIVLIMLVLVLFFGTEVFGAKRWLDVGVFALQPSEVMKLILILVVARIVTAEQSLNFRRLLAAAVVLALTLLLTLKQPDLGTSSVLVVVAGALIVHARPPKWFWPLIIMVGLIFLPTAWSQLKTYQKDRLKTFFYPSSDPTGIGYNVAQAKIAIGAGGIWGRGLGQGSQSQLNFLPVAHTDFIFAAIAESWGFVGSSALVILYAILVWRSFNVALLSQDAYGHFVALGIATMFLFQSVVNIGMNLGLLPVTGIPLPFVSFGGSGMLTNFAAVGILQSIYIRHKKIRFG